MTLANKITRIKSFQLFKFIFYKEKFCFIIANFYVRLDSLASKSVSVIKFPCANLALKVIAAKLLNSGEAAYLW